MERKKLGIYIHIPFCVSKCNYCSFISFCNIREQECKNYVNACLIEMKSYANIKNEYLVDTIYIGGGTPSTLFYGGISTLISGVKKYFNVSSNPEITVECNPNSLTIQKLREYKKAGVNRISIGLQCYSDKVLKCINRPHDKKDFVYAMQNIKLVGFNNVSVDMILGLPHQRKSTIRRTINKIAKYNVPHVSCYSLILEEGTKLYDMVQANQIEIPSEDKSVEMYDLANKLLKEKGYERYEVSNFAIKGYESKHNYKYWSGEDYVGIGVASHSLVKNERYHSFENLKDYINYYNATQTEESVIVPATKKLDCEVLDESSKREERIMLSLRTREGLDLVSFENDFSENLLETKKEEIEELKKLGLVGVTKDSIKLTDEGFHLLNQVILKLV